MPSFLRSNQTNLLLLHGQNLIYICQDSMEVLSHTIFVGGSEDVNEGFLFSACNLKLPVNRTNQRVSSNTLRFLCKKDHTQFLSLQNSSLYNYSFDHATHEKKSNWV